MANFDNPITAVSRKQQWNGWLMLAVSAMLVLAMVGYLYQQMSLSAITPAKVFHYQLHMSFKPQGKDVVVGTYLPNESERQKVLRLRSEAANMERNDFNSSHGLVSRWRGNEASESIKVAAILQLSSVQFDLPTDLAISNDIPNIYLPYLMATDDVQVHSPEISALWQQIKPQNDTNMLAVLNSIYNYTSSLEPLAFKGGTDALTALRLGAASCNGKSRLFTALARLNNIPTRLVGGVILKDGKKKTSHQWVEVSVNHQWVPFDPTNNHFASLPDNYLELYRGDLSLFSHTKNIDFDYQFTIEGQRIAQALLAGEGDSAANANWLQKLKTKLGVSEQTFAIFLLMPLCALVITVLRNVFGFQSFGVFMPMLIASACTLVGLYVGLMGFVLVLALAVATYALLAPLKLLKIPRLAILITVINMITLVGLMQVEQQLSLQSGLLSLFPVIVISFVADKMHDLITQRDWTSLVKSTFGTAVSIFMCFYVLQSSTLQNAFILFPELYFFVVVGQIYFGRWTGARLNELLRFRHARKFSDDVIGINSRNKKLVNELNSPQLLQLAADKLSSKQALARYDVPVPGTLARFDSLIDLKRLPKTIAKFDQFVVKPNAGSQGNGILVIKDNIEKTFISASGKEKTFFDIYGLVHDIINGHYSQLGDSDIAYIEPLIQQHSSLAKVSPDGLCDVRVVLLHGKVINAMLRIPTKKSGGKANLHQGAIGAALDLKTGSITGARQFNQDIDRHPDSGARLTDIQLPQWQQILDMSEKCFAAIPLGYMGVDICIDNTRGPLVLEVNGRPGLEIQNVTKRGLATPINDHLRQVSAVKA